VHVDRNAFSSASLFLPNDDIKHDEDDTRTSPDAGVKIGCGLVLG
jgi:hypothetical protein